VLAVISKCYYFVGNWRPTFLEGHHLLVKFVFSNNLFNRWRLKDTFHISRQWPPHKFVVSTKMFKVKTLYITRFVNIKHIRVGPSEKCLRFGSTLWRSPNRVEKLGFCFSVTHYRKQMNICRKKSHKQNVFTIKKHEVGHVNINFVHWESFILVKIITSEPKPYF
jgi:hypothetical protein